MILFNVLAALIALIAVILGGIAMELFDSGGALLLTTTGSAIVMDLTWRLTRGRDGAIARGGGELPPVQDVARSLFHPGVGGHVFFLPVWFATVCIAIYAVISALT